MPSRAVLFLVVFIGCADSAEAPRACEAEAPTVQLSPRAEGRPCDASVTSSRSGDASFADDHVLCVSVTMDPLEFEELRYDSRFGPLDGGCFSEDFGAAMTDCTRPWPSGFQWFSADVVVDGVALNNVGVRKKGTLGSVTSVSPSLKLRTNKYVEEQRLGQTQRITLNNNVEDQARVTSCLAYSVFEQAGLPAPRCNLANLVVNGRAFGAYTHIEALKKAFLRRAFGNDHGSLYEGTDVDFHASFHGRWETKTKDTDPLVLAIAEIEVALQQSDADLLSALAPRLNIDRFIAYWSLEIIVGHGDGFTAARNNAMIYFDPDDGGRGTFIPWSAGGWRGEASVTLDQFNQSLLTQRLIALPSIRSRLKAQLEAHLQTAFDEDALLARLETSAGQVRSAETIPEFESRVAEVRTWIRTRRATIEGLIAQDFNPQAMPAAQCGADQ